MFAKLKKRMNKKGFTVIELIVVVAILAALAALALPTMNGIVKNAEERVAESNARTVFTAAQVYYTQNPTATGDVDEAKLEPLLGTGMGGTYSATGGAGECTEATWEGVKYKSTYTAADGTFKTTPKE